jgi:catechol 2,3-dioxygenase-like lactoylglutathione lyase family enzyme
MQLDHIELLVPDQWEAAEWYERVLGFSVIQEHVHWAEEGGPLMITNDDGQTMLALFRGAPQADSEVIGFGRVAFRVNSDDFMRFLEDSSGWRQPALSPADVVDHDKSFSVYFTDPYGNRLEVTSYDYAALRARLSNS